jgi:hypothetical protein
MAAIGRKPHGEGRHMSFRMRVTGLLIGIAALLGLGIGTANAQVYYRPGGTTPTAASSTAAKPAAKAQNCSNFDYISGNGVRIRRSPGGRILGYAWYWERVLRWNQVGSYVYVTFLDRNSGVQAGWVASQFVSTYAPTCW